jgi:hypothetical protein
MSYDAGSTIMRFHLDTDEHQKAAEQIRQDLATSETVAIPDQHGLWLLKNGEWIGIPYANAEQIRAMFKEELFSPEFIEEIKRQIDAYLAENVVNEAFPPRFSPSVKLNKQLIHRSNSSL